MPDLKSVGSGTLLVASNVFAAFASFVVLALIFNRLGLQSFGQVSFMMTLVAIFQVVFNTQSWQGLLHENLESSGRVLAACFVLDTGLAIVGSAILWGAAGLLFVRFADSPAPPSSLRWLAMIVAFAPPGAALAAIRGHGRYAAQAVVDIASSSLKLGLGLAARHAEGALAASVAALLLPEVLRWVGYGLTCLRMQPHVADGAISTPAALARVYRFSGWGMLSEIGHLPSSYLDKVIVGGTLGLGMLAIWDIVKRCVVAFVQVTNVLNQMLFPHFIRSRASTSDRKLLTDTLRHSVLLGGAIGLCYAILLATFSLWFPKVFHLPPNSPMSAGQIRWLMLAFSAVMTFVLGAIPVHPLFLSLRHSSETFRLAIAGNAMSLLLTWFLVRPLGLYGAVVAILASDGLIILGKIAILRAQGGRPGFHSAPLT